MLHHDENYGKYGLLRLNYLKEHKPVHYNSLLSSGELSRHLHDVNQCATAEVEQLIASFIKECSMPDKKTSPEK